METPQIGDVFSGKLRKDEATRGRFGRGSSTRRLRRTSGEKWEITPTSAVSRGDPRSPGLRPSISRDQFSPFSTVSL